MIRSQLAHSTQWRRDIHEIKSGFCSSDGFAELRIQRSCALAGATCPLRPRCILHQLRLHCVCCRAQKYMYTQVLEYVPRLAITPQQRTHRHISAQQNSTKGSLSLTIYYMNFFARPEEQLFTPMAIKESPHRCKKPRADVCKHINEHVQRLLDQKNRLIWEMMRWQTCAPRRLDESGFGAAKALVTLL